MGKLTNFVITSAEQARSAILLLLVLCWLVLGGEPTYSARSPEALSNLQITLLPDGVQLIWHAPKFEEVLQPDGSVSLTMPGFENETAPGLPIVPVASRLIALPPNAEPTLLIDESGVLERPLPHQLAINPQPDGVLRDENGSVIGGATSPAQPKPDTTSVLSLTETGTLRGVRLARLTFSPIRVANGMMQITKTF